MHTCAIDIHHHYMPPGLIEELKAHGKAVATEVGRTPEGLNTLTFGNGPSFMVPPPLMDVEKRLETMDKGKIAMATLEPHTACLGYRLKRGHLVWRIVHASSLKNSKLLCLIGVS